MHTSSTHYWDIQQMPYAIIKTIQKGSRLTFQLASPLASDRSDSLAKTNFSLARRRHLSL